MIDLNTYTSDWDTVSLKELDSVALYKRIDTKYVLNLEQLMQLMDLIKVSHKILEIDKIRVFAYSTNYFDTSDFQFYTDHHNGFLNRIKVRQREYTNSDLKFYEIKRKLPGEHTDKTRVRIDQMHQQLSKEHYDMIDYKRLRNRPLEIKMSNAFNRMTLTSHNLEERITIDTNITFIGNGKKISLPEIVVLELKQPRYDVTNLIVQTLKKMRIYPSSFSKYTIGVSLLNLHRKQNQFKPQLLKIRQYQIHTN
ncbi:MAG TPA: polyphosphate polymerase domain-containing protein [Chitinophagales bacterium]|nr:polyphosphate polymerase domain-containing protein [Chitinophagales bacterium]